MIKKYCDIIKLKESDFFSDKVNNEHDLRYKRLLTHKKIFIEGLRDFVKKDWLKLTCLKDSGS